MSLELNTIYVLVHTDPGNDIDDEVACGHLIRTFLHKEYPSYNIHIVFSIKTKNIQRLIDYGLKPYSGFDFNPSFNVDNIIPINCDFTLTIVFHDGTTFVPDSYRPDYFLNISPGADNIVKSLNLVNLKGLSHQGLPDSGNGFNDNQGKIIQQIIATGIPTEITTPFESFKTLFSNEIFEKYSVPISIRDKIASEAANMITGRLSKNCPKNVLNFAEGLINIRYAETLGKPGTNCRLALAIREKYTEPIQEISPEMDDWIRNACNVYLSSIRESAFDQGATEDPIKFYDETLEHLYKMTKALYEMDLPCFDDSFIRLRYSTDGDFAENHPDAFEKFKNIGIFTPAYDLIATIKLIDMLKFKRII